MFACFADGEEGEEGLFFRRRAVSRAAVSGPQQLAALYMYLIEKSQFIPSICPVCVDVLRPVVAQCCLA